LVGVYFFYYKGCERDLPDQFEVAPELAREETA
jgi:hypothetical protein